MSVKTLLVDARNFGHVAPQIIEQVRQKGLHGFDIETEDSRRHAGLNAFMRVDDDGAKAKNKPLIFDVNRTTVTGFSLFPAQADTAYYVNLAHADTENRVSWGAARALLDARQPGSFWVAHNAPFELTMMKMSLGYELTDILCSLQACVSAYGPDEYPMAKFQMAGLGGIAKLMSRVSAEFRDFQPGSEMSSSQAELFNMVVAKESDAAHSYNGFVGDIRYGYDLKLAIKSWFGVQMTTFQELLGRHGAVHMGQLTGEQVVEYGADDAYWAIRLLHRVFQHMQETNPKVLTTYLEQENPMIHTFAQIWSEGIKINRDEVELKRQEERHNAADCYRRIKAAVRKLMPFQAQPHDGMMKREGWYQKGYQAQRNRLSLWAQSADSDDDYKQCRQASGAVSNSWGEERGEKKSAGPNLGYWQQMRLMIYDLMQQKCIIEHGKVQSDAGARGKVRERVGKQDQTPQLQASEELLAAMSDLASLEQRMKLYLTPYSLLVDPDTSRMYPTVSSMLATRRMGCRTPNTMQLAKHNPESAYVRGFYEADDEDQVLVSGDWSQIELVLIGEDSGDPEFAKVYGQKPFKDLHLGAAADILSMQYGLPVSEADFASLKTMADEIEAPFGFPLVDHRGVRLTPKDAFKWNRGTAGGKGANFGYWYSGALSSVAAARGIGPDLMWKMTEAYRQRYAVAEQWRLGVIEFAKTYGYVELPDGHRRYKLECTPTWAATMQGRFGVFNDPGIVRFGNAVVNKISRRAGNQVVNAKIQGTCATIAKRSIIRIEKEAKACGFRKAFKMPIHDELVYSVHREEAVDFIEMAYGVMCDHKDIVNKLAMDSSFSVGRNFQPFGKRAPLGQIELDEAPSLAFVPPELIGSKLPREMRQAAVDYLFAHERRAAA